MSPANPSDVLLPLPASPAEPVAPNITQASPETRVAAPPFDEALGEALKANSNDVSFSAMMGAATETVHRSIGLSLTLPELSEPDDSDNSEATDILRAETPHEVSDFFQLFPTPSLSPETTSDKKTLAKQKHVVQHEGSTRGSTGAPSPAIAADPPESIPVSTDTRPIVFPSPAEANSFSPAGAKTPLLETHLIESTPLRSSKQFTVSQTDVTLTDQPDSLPPDSAPAQPARTETSRAESTDAEKPERIVTERHAPRSAPAVPLPLNASSVSITPNASSVSGDDVLPRLEVDPSLLSTEADMASAAKETVRSADASVLIAQAPTPPPRPKAPSARSAARSAEMTTPNPPVPLAKVIEEYQAEHTTIQWTELQRTPFDADSPTSDADALNRPQANEATHPAPTLTKETPPPLSAKASPASMEAPPEQPLSNLAVRQDSLNQHTPARPAPTDTTLVTSVSTDVVNAQPEPTAVLVDTSIVAEATPVTEVAVIESDHTQPPTSERTAAPLSSAKSEPVTLPRPILSAAWLQRLGEMTPRALDGMWQTVRLALGDGDGELTVSTRRDDERIAVTISFSDPRLRALAADHAERLQGALETRYDADVDLSFSEHDGGASHEQSADAEQTLRSFVQPTSTPGAEQDTEHTPLSTGHHEWIG